MVRRIFRLAWLLLLLASPRIGASQEDYSAQLPRIAPTPADQALHTFAVAQGYRMELIAAEPLVTSPVVVQWDENGRLYVCEMRGYSEHRDDAISRITILDDLNDDGIFDSSTVFADGLRWPTAIFPYDQGLFVVDAPDLLFLKDTTGDSIADRVVTVMTGLGTSNVQGLANSFRWGLDNRIHLACSSNGGEIRRTAEDGTPLDTAAISVRGRDLALDPRSLEFEVTSGGGQHGMAFDDWGRKFVSSNSDHIQQVLYAERDVARNRFADLPTARLSIAEDGPQAEVFRISPVEPWRLLRTRLRVSGLASGPIEGGGRASGYFTGATGITIYRGDAWPEADRGMAIVGDVGGNLIHRKRLEPNGVAMIARRIDPQSEFVASSDIWFRPAQFANAPDGSLHVVDVYREVIEHPKSLPPDIKRHLDLNAGRDRGRLYRIVPESFTHRPTPRLSSLSTAALVELLAHPNAWHRETASRLIYQRQDIGVVELLVRMADDSPSPLGRLHAMHALSGLKCLNTEILLQRLRDEHPQVRRHAIELSESFASDPSLNLQWLAMIDDPSIEVRYRLALALGRVDARTDAGRSRPSALAALIRRDVDDLWMRAAVQSSLAEGAAELFCTLIVDRDFRSTHATAFLRSIAQQIRRRANAGEIRAALSALPLIDDELDGAWALTVFGPLLRDPSSPQDASTIRRYRARWIQEAIKVASHHSDLPTRVGAVESIGVGPWDEIQEAIVGWIDHQQPPEIQVAAIRALGGFDSPDASEALVKAWGRLGPSAREAACEVLFSRVERLPVLLDAIDAGRIAIGEIAPVRWEAAYRSKISAEIRDRLANYVTRGHSGRRTHLVSAYRAALSLPSDVDRGRNLFAVHCAGCHRFADVGHEIGPNLATLNARGAESILVNVLDPNAEVNPQYLLYILLTTDGRTLSGMIVGENANSVTLTRAHGATDTISREEIEELRSSGVSLMPEGLEQVLDTQAMADLIGYLMGR